MQRVRKRESARQDQQAALSFQEVHVAHSLFPEGEARGLVQPFQPHRCSGQNGRNGRCDSARPVPENENHHEISRQLQEKGGEK